MALFADPVQPRRRSQYLVIRISCRIRINPTAEGGFTENYVFRAIGLRISRSLDSTGLEVWVAPLRVSPRRNDSILCCLILIMSSGWIVRPAHAQQLDACTPPPAVEAALDAVPLMARDDTEWEFHEKTLAAVQGVLRQYPNDVFVQQRYVDEMRGRTERPKVIEEYRARLAANPDRPTLAYLYGLTLVGRQSAESIKLFDTALEEDPKFPWPHLQLVWIYSSPVFQDKSKAGVHLKAFLDVCPARFEGYSALRQIDDNSVVRQRAAQLRALLEKRDDPDAINAYRTLWALEFKINPPSEYEALRKRVAADVQRIRGLSLSEKWEWYDALEDGYKLANDRKNADWANEQRELHAPNPWEPASLERWYQEREAPGADATPDIRRAYYSDLLKQTTKWIKECPNATFIWSIRLDALTQLDDVAPAETETVAEQLMKVAQKNAGPSGLTSQEYFSAARALSRKHLLPERVAELAQKGLEQLKIEQTEPDFDFYADKEEAARTRFYNAVQLVQGLGYLSEAYIELEQPDKAQIALSQMDEQLQDLKSLAGDRQDRKKSYLEQLSAYWSRLAHLTELQDRRLDAMAFYENALLSRLEAEQKPDSGVKDELAESAKKLWTSLGGTDEGWMTWYGRRAEESSRLTTLRWEDANEPLPKFELADLNGKIWNLESLKGKVTFLNFWASW